MAEGYMYIWGEDPSLKKSGGGHPSGASDAERCFSDCGQPPSRTRPLSEYIEQNQFFYSWLIYFELFIVLNIVLSKHSRCLYLPLLHFLNFFLILIQMKWNKNFYETIER